MADNALPPEYQAELEAALKKQQIAQMLLQRSMNPSQPVQGRVASRISPLAGLANILGGVAGGVVGSQASDEASGVRKRFATDEAADLTKMQGLSEDAAIKAGQTSQFTRSRELAKSMWEAAQKRRGESGKIVADSGDTQGGLNILNGGSTTDYKPPALKQPNIEWITDPNNPGKVIPKTTNYDKFGLGKAQLGAQGSSTNVKIDLPGEEGKYALKRESEDLEGRQTSARAAQQILATTERLMQALQAGSDQGGLSDARQMARKFFSAFGANLPETGPTDSAKQLFGESLLVNAKKLGINPTDTDAKRIQEIVGTIDTDPNAVPQLLAYLNGGALKTLQDFGTFVETKRTQGGAQRYPGLYDTADIGIKLPTQLYGPQDVQLRTIEALRQAGGDITKFRAPPVAGEKEGKPFDAGSIFDLKNKPITPNAPPVAAQPGTVQQPLRVDQLTPAQRQQLKEMLGG